MEEKKKLTLVEKFEKYNGKTFCVKNITVQGFSKIKFIVVGYRKNSNYYLIGKLVGNLGISEHFQEPTKWDIIKGHERGNNYFYVNLRMIDDYEPVKTKVSRKEIINEIETENFKF